MSDRVINAILVSTILTVVPIIYKKINNNKKKKEIDGKIYYGIIRILLLYIAAICSSEIVLMLVLDTETIKGFEALLLTIICSIPFMYMYLLIYKKYQIKKLKNNKNNLKSY